MGRTPLAAVGLLLGAAMFTGCSGSGGKPPAVVGEGSSPRLQSVHYGLLADIYGLQPGTNGSTFELFQTDVLVGPDITDERASGSTKANSEISFDFLTTDVDTLQPRILITREIGTAEFQQKFDALDDQCRLLQPGVFGQNTTVQPFSLVARNSALRLTFTHDLGLTEDFFVNRAPTGEIVGINNTEAVQLLEIVGDPNDPNPAGDFRPLDTRIVPRANTLILDPVLLGSEGIQYQAANNATGLPESADQISANIRVALALEGQLAIPGLRPNTEASLSGLNNNQQNSVIRDFRSGNRLDNTPEVSQGFLRDPLPLSIVGHILMYVENVEDGPQAGTKVLTVYKNGVEHEIDIGDTFRIIPDNSGTIAAVTEVIVDPADDLGVPTVQHVRVIVRRQEGPNGEDLLEQQDPSNLPGYPATEAEREPWLVQNAPKAVLVAEFTFERRDPLGNLYGDLQENFLVFTPRALPKSVEQPVGSGQFVSVPSDPGENVSPFAGAVLRFNKPVDIATVKGLDTFFFGTRDLLSQAEATLFQQTRGIDPAVFIHDKYLTPHLVFANVFDEDGSQTSLRLQPKLGFYLDESMRQAANPSDVNYFLHVVGGQVGIKDLSGNLLDFQSLVTPKDNIVFEFGVDLRRNSVTGAALYPNNFAVTVARRFAHEDEDEQPSYYLPAEVEGPGETKAEAFNLRDMFGPVIYNTGRLEARQTSRVTQWVDNINQQPAPPQDITDPSTGQLIPNPNRACPHQWGPPAPAGEAQLVPSSTQNLFGNPLQNPLNPRGCRLQTVWRELDMSLSRTDPLDFNLDVEQMYWCPFTSLPIYYDEFDQVSLFLGHSERRPEPCIGQVQALPTFGGSGLVPEFDLNYLQNFDLQGNPLQGPARHIAYADQRLTVLSSLAITEPTGTYKYLPLPTFQQPYFVWRDERVQEQGANMAGFDTNVSRVPNFTDPYLLSPFLGGLGRFSYQPAGGGPPSFNVGYWDNRNNWNIERTNARDDRTDGLVGSIALPLLGDFWTYPDSPTEPIGNPFTASGATGWQVSLAVTSSFLPAFRVYSAGGLVQGEPRTVDPSTQTRASGGFTPSGVQTRASDNTTFWIAADYLKRLTIATGGFVDIWDPHRIQVRPPGIPPAATANWDPRLGPYFNPNPQTGPSRLPSNVVPSYDWSFEPPLTTLPNGTALNVEFRGAGNVDPAPWHFLANPRFNRPGPDWTNVPLDPLKAGDAHIRKFDDRGERDAWTYFYHRNVTDYSDDLNNLADSIYTNQFSGPNEAFDPQDVRYFNWRFVFTNNVQVSPPIHASIESFAVTYRFDVQ